MRSAVQFISWFIHFRVCPEEVVDGADEKEMFQVE